MDKERRLGRLSKELDVTMHVVFVASSVLLLFFAALSLIFPGFAVAALMAAIVAMVWNYIDALGGVTASVDQLKEGDRLGFLINFITHTNLFVGTTLWLAAVATHLTAGALLSIAAPWAALGFVCCMLGCLALEVRATWKSWKKLEELRKTQESSLDSAHQIEYNRKILRAEKAFKHHSLMILAWVFCVGITTFSAVSGILALSTGVIAVTAVIFLLVGAYRYFAARSLAKQDGRLERLLNKGKESAHLEETPSQEMSHSKKKTLSELSLTREKEEGADATDRFSKGEGGDVSSEEDTPTSEP